MNYSNHSSMEAGLDLEATNFQVSKLFIITVYAVLSFGILFNCAVASTIVNIFVQLKGNLTNKHTFIYILALSIVDACVLSNVPVIILDILRNRWELGLVVCKIFWTMDSVNKVLSTFILTALSFDRYLAICKPTLMPQWKSVKCTITVLLLCLLFAAALLYPCYAKAEVLPYNLPAYNLSTVKCAINWRPSEGRTFIHYIFALGYCIPLSLMTFFHCCIMHRIWRNEQRMRNVRKSTTARQVAVRTTFLVVFYFSCWTPYWTTTFYINYVQIMDFSWVPMAALTIHILVYLNSAVNPFLYALLNMELRRQHHKAVEINNRRSHQIILDNSHNVTDNTKNSHNVDSTMLMTDCTNLL